MPKCHFNKVAKQLRYGSSLVNLQHIFRTLFPRIISERLLLKSFFEVLLSGVKIDWAQVFVILE